MQLHKYQYNKLLLFTKWSTIGQWLQLGLAFHPQTDGQTERMNHTLEDMLRHYVNPNQNDWDTYLTVVEFAINNAWQASVQNTPFFLNYGQHPFTPLTLQVESHVPGAQKYLQDRTEVIQHAKTCLKAAQDRQKTYADTTRRDVNNIRVGLSENRFFSVRKT